jgi:hypothetical protein
MATGAEAKARREELVRGILAAGHDDVVASAISQATTNKQVAGWVAEAILGFVGKGLAPGAIPPHLTGAMAANVSVVVKVAFGDQESDVKVHLTSMNRSQVQVYASGREEFDKGLVDVLAFPDPALQMECLAAAWGTVTSCHEHVSGRVTLFGTGRAADSAAKGSSAADSFTQVEVDRIMTEMTKNGEYLDPQELAELSVLKKIYLAMVQGGNFVYDESLSLSAVKPYEGKDLSRATDAGKGVLRFDDGGELTLSSDSAVTVKRKALDATDVCDQMMMVIFGTYLVWYGKKVEVDGHSVDGLSKQAVDEMSRLVRRHAKSEKSVTQLYDDYNRVLMCIRRATNQRWGKPKVSLTMGFAAAFREFEDLERSVSRMKAQDTRLVHMTKALEAASAQIKTLERKSGTVVPRSYCLFSSARVLVCCFERTRD